MKTTKTTKKSLTPNNWEFTQLAPNVHRLRFTGLKAGDERSILLGSDDHWDSTDCNRQVLREHLSEAQARNAPIFRFGDLFDCMGGKWDKRGVKDKVRPELQVHDYLSKLPRIAADWYAEFPNLALITPGNHETAITKKHEVDLMQLMQDRLHSKGLKTMIGGYWGFVQIQFQKSNSTQILQKTLYYHHGYGGGGAVTAGMIDNSRTRDDYIADIYYSGHIHRRNLDDRVVTRLSKHGNIERSQQLFLRGSAYKCEHKPYGFHVENGRAARPLGGWWLNFGVSFKEQSIMQVKMSPEMAL